MEIDLGRLAGYIYRIQWLWWIKIIVNQLWPKVRSNFLSSIWYVVCFCNLVYVVNIYSSVVFGI